MKFYPKSSFPLRKLVSPKFLRELHHFLWTDPCMIDNSVDAGWNCRDHAWILNFLLQGFGFETLIAHGEAFFGARSGARHQSVSYTQIPHSWVVIKGLGAVDISIKRRFVNAGDQFEMPVDWVFLNNAPPLSRCTAVFCNHRQDYQRAVDDFHLQNRPAGAVYLADSLERLDDTHFNHGAAWMRSPLAHGLRERSGQDPSPLYIALLHHMAEFISGRASGLAGLPFDDAWDFLRSSAGRNTDSNYSATWPPAARPANP